MSVAKVDKMARQAGSSCRSSAAPRSAAARLARDYREVISEPVPGITAHPLDENIFEWHCNIIAPDHSPFAGMVVHLKLEFPETYPSAPPEVHLLTGIPHSNVINSRWNHETYPGMRENYLCLDMLRGHDFFRDSGEYHNTAYEGWSSAYTVLSVLHQLQCFLLADSDTKIEQFYDGYAKSNSLLHHADEAVRLAESFCCPGCGHRGVPAAKADIVPVISSAEVKANTTLGKRRRKLLKKLRDIEALKSFEKSGCEIQANQRHKMEQEASVREELLALEQPMPAAEAPAESAAEVVAEVVACLPCQSGPAGPGLATEMLDPLDLLPDDVLLAMLMQLSRHELRQFAMTSRRHHDFVRAAHIGIQRDLRCFHSKSSFTEGVLGVGVLVQRRGRAPAELTSPLDLLSHDAFHTGVRLGVWKEPFSDFLPLAICPDHAARARPRLEQSIAALAGQRQFSPQDVLEVLPRLMSTMVVQLFDGGAAVPSRHASDKALLGYCGFHHLLLQFCAWYPALRQRIDARVDAFHEKDDARTKRVTPNLGEFLPLLTASRRRWGDVAGPFMREVLDRNVRWLLDARPHLAGSGVDGDTRLAESFHGSLTSYRLLMFQVHFLTHIGRPTVTTVAADGGAQVVAVAPRDVLANYDRRFGRPTPAQQRELQEMCRAVQEVHGWNSFFSKVTLAAPSKASMVQRLEDAVANSERKGYHRSFCSNRGGYDNRGGSNGGYRRR